MNINSTNIDIRELLREGQAALDTHRAVRETALRGVYRAGSAGCVDNDTVFGECHRVAHARSLGHDKQVDGPRKIMFAGGESNEDIWARTLVGGWSGGVARGRELERDLGDGVRVLGSPDIVLTDGDRDVCVLELKQVCALNKGIAVHLEGEPDSKHLVQSAAYMWLSGLPAVLCYTNRSDFSIQFQAKKLGLKRLEPFYHLYYLSFRGDRLFYRDEFKADEIPTRVTTQGIEDYYRLLKRMELERTLLERPSDDHVNGDAARYARCDYCPLQGACDTYESDYVTWLDAVGRVCREGAV